MSTHWAIISQYLNVLDQAFRRDPARVLAFAVDATAAHPSLVVDAVNNLSKGNSQGQRPELGPGVC